MKVSCFFLAVGIMIGFLVGGPAMADQSVGHAPYGQGDDSKRPNGVIGISLQIGAERIGDPAILYVGMVHPEGPAHKAGLRHGDEIITVDGVSVTGKRYEQVINMIRGEPGTSLKLGVKAEEGPRELSVTRVAGEQLSKWPSGSHGQPAP